MKKTRALSSYSNPLLRISMGLVFLYFGFVQIISPDNWAGYVPKIVTSTILTANNIVIINGIVEITLGIFLIIGLYTRISALILSIHLAGISFSFGLSPIGIRDWGITLATFVIFLNGPDKYCLDTKIRA